MAPKIAPATTTRFVYLGDSDDKLYIHQNAEDEVVHCIRNRLLERKRRRPSQKKILPTCWWPRLSQQKFAVAIQRELSLDCNHEVNLFAPLLTANTTNTMIIDPIHLHLLMTRQPWPKHRQWPQVQALREQLHQRLVVVTQKLHIGSHEACVRIHGCVTIHSFIYTDSKFLRLLTDVLPAQRNFSTYLLEEE